MLLIINYWELFCTAFGLMLLFSFYMGLLSLDFYTMDVVKKKFSIMDLEVPAKPIELANLIRGLYKLPRPDAIKAIRALRWHFCFDFLFMPCAYGSVFLLCMLVSSRMELTFGGNIFTVLAWLQVIPWVCDIIENIYLLRKIKPHPRVSTKAVHKAYLIMEGVKWGIALIASICAISAVCYFWLSQNYGAHSLNYMLIAVIEIMVFLILGKLFLKEKKPGEESNWQV